MAQGGAAPVYRLVAGEAQSVSAPRLDPTQQAVVDHPAGPLLVLAGPGTGKMTTIVEAVGSRGPRSVGRVMSTYGGSVPWWRVVRADGSLPPSHDDEARAHYLDEGTVLRPSGRIDMPHAFWQP